MPALFSYTKQEKLKSRKMLEQVFAGKKSFTIFPFKVFYFFPVEVMNFPVKAGVGTSGKFFKKAVDRNRIKRLIRETYRVHKTPLYDFITKHNKQVAFFILYIGKELPHMHKLQIKMPLVIDKLINALHENNVANN
jgi:ribonuclease P protein component